MARNALEAMVKLFFFGLAVVVGLWFLIKFDEWSGGFRKYLLATGNWEYLIYLAAFAFAISYIIKRLIKSAFHAEFVKRKR